MNSIKKSIKVYLIATEPSGDIIGSNLIKSLKKAKNKVQIFGIGKGIGYRFWHTSR